MKKFLPGLYSNLWKFIDYLFPPKCVNCFIPGYSICPDCLKLLEFIHPPICEICGIPRKTTGNCRLCIKGETGYDLLRSVTIYKGPIQKAIQANKYRRDIAVGLEISNILTDYVGRMVFPIDLIIPIPLGKQRFIERGYNQVATFAFPTALKLNIEYNSKALVRVKETRKQVGLSAVDRKINMENAFLAKESSVKGRNILLLDDVATTGSTLSSGAVALMNSGANNVYAVSVARALQNSKWQ